MHLIEKKRKRVDIQSQKVNIHFKIIQIILLKFRRLHYVIT
jgi:hypothetical protein